MSAIKTSLDAMTEVRKRVRVHDTQIVTKLPAPIKELISEVAGIRGVSDSTIVREAIAEYMTKRGYKR